MKNPARFHLERPRDARKFLLPATVALAAACFLAIPTRATTFTVHSTDASPFDGTAKGVQPGDTIVLDGQTRTHFTFVNITGASGNPVTITNAGGATGQFIYDNGSDPNGDTFYFLGCNHVVLKGTASPGNYDYGIKVAGTASGKYGIFFGANGSVGSSDFEIKDIEIGHTGYAGLGAQCSGLKASSGFVMNNVKIHGLYIHDTGGEGMYIGSSFYAVSDPMDSHYDPHEIHGAEIYNNTVENAGWDGIQLGCATTGASIHDNVINGYGALAPDTSQNEGIRSNPGTAADIYNNLIIGSTGSGDGIQANPYNSIKVYNNVLVTPHESGITFYEQAATRSYVSGYSIKLFNNTLVSPSHDGFNIQAPNSSGNLAYNNLIANPGSGYAYFVVGATTSVTEATELFVATEAAAGFADASSANYRLASGSSAIDAGTSVSSYGVTTDADGVARPQGTAYDIGAFEYVPPAVGILAVSGFGQAGGSYCPATGALDEQPTWDATNQAPTGVSANPYTATGTAYASRYWYVDFGPNYSKVRITGTWTRYMPYTTGNNAGFGTMWWDDDNDSTNDNGVTETGINFGTAQGLNTGSGQLWVQDTNHSSSPITPQGRYLIIGTGSAPATRANEFVFVGYTVP